MKSLLSLLVVAIGIGAVYPLVAEQADSYCSALDSRTKFLATQRIGRAADHDAPLPVVFQAQAQTPASSVWVADYIIRRSLARLPEPVACDIIYWHSVAFPDAHSPVRTARR